MGRRFLKPGDGGSLTKDANSTFEPGDNSVKSVFVLDELANSDGFWGLGGGFKLESHEPLAPSLVL